MRSSAQAAEVAGYQTRDQAPLPTHPTKPLTELDCTRYKSMAGLCQNPNGAAQYIIFAHKSMNRHLIVEVFKLESRMKPWMDPRHLRALNPIFIE